MEIVKVHNYSLQNFFITDGSTIGNSLTFLEWFPLSMVLYFIGLILFSLSRKQLSIWIGSAFITFSFLLQSLVLVERSTVLSRPPITNMQETLLYTAWLLSGMSLYGLWILKRKPFVILTSSGALALLIAPWLTKAYIALDPTPEILNSSFWLTFHVITVVTSYGIFILFALMSHLFLFNPRLAKKGLLNHSFQVQTLPFSGKNFKMSLRKSLCSAFKKEKFPLVSYLYWGTFFLVTGTLLGGVWAEQSWGRFWDWDPKESWAFVSSCYYLSAIHLYRSHRMGLRGLIAVGCYGFLLISFTWYGVNYLLGAGLHSYGVGKGGEVFYLSALGLDFALVTFLLTRFKSRMRTAS